MPCIAPPRGITDVQFPWSDGIDNNPCGKDEYAAGLCKLHWQMKNGLVQPGGIDAFTVFLFHADSLVDALGHPLTAVGDAKISAAQSKFGGSSAVFDGVGDMITTPDSPDWSFGAGDFTVDLQVNWIDPATPANQQLIGQWGTTGGQFGWLLRFAAPSSMNFYYSTDGANFPVFTFAFTPIAGTWYHVALVRNGNNCMCFVNGAQAGATGSFAGATIFDPAAALSLGGSTPSAGTPFNGYLDEVRISKGIARWTAPFSVPTTPYT